MPSSFHMKQKTFKNILNQIVPIIYALEMTFPVVATFDGLWVPSFQTESKACCVLWSVRAFFGFPEKENQINTAFRKLILLFYMLKVNWYKNLSSKEWHFKMQVVLLPVSWVDTKITFGFDFMASLSPCI